MTERLSDTEITEALEQYECRNGGHYISGGPLCNCKVAKALRELKELRAEKNLANDAVLYADALLMALGGGE